MPRKLPEPFEVTPERLRSAAEGLGVSQTEFAALMGLDGRTMRRYMASPDTPTSRPIPPLVARMVYLLECQPRALDALRFYNARMEP